MLNLFKWALALSFLAALTSGSILAAPAIGSKVADFTLPRASGGSYSLKEAQSKNKFIVLIFVATQCPYSNAYNARMAELPARFQGRGIEFVGINSNKTEPNEEIVEHANKNHLSFPILKDDGNKIADRFDAKKTPEVYIIDSKGVLKYHGRIDENYQDASAVKSPDLDDALKALLSGKAIKNPVTKAFGCSIKRV